MSKTLAILGAGHLGQQIAHYAIDDKHYDNVVYFDDYCKDKYINGHEVIGTSATIEQLYDKKKFDELIIGIGYNHIFIKKQFFNNYKSKIPFGTIIHSTCRIDRTAIIKEGSVLYPNCCIDAGAVIKENSLLNLSCTVAHDSVIGEHSFISPNVTVSGFVHIGEACIIGVSTTIIDNIKIASGIKTGGGTVVIKNLDKPGLYVGNPARYIR